MFVFFKDIATKLSTAFLYYIYNMSSKFNDILIVDCMETYTSIQYIATKLIQLIF